MRFEQTFDYVIIGAGSAGCVIAHRLSEPKEVSVLLLEAGGPDSRRELHSPAASDLMDLWGGAAWSAELDWGYSTEPEPQLNGRRVPILCGKVVGGGSSVNAMLYVRGNHRDYDHWNYLGNQDWSYQSVLPLFKKSENFEGGPCNYHGDTGPLSVVTHDSPTPAAWAFVQGLMELGYGGPCWDFNGPTQEGGAGFYQSTKTRDRKRCSAAIAFLGPIRQHPNFTLRTGSQVRRLLFEGDRAIGVEYLHGGASHRVRAAREVVLCAGALESPKLLMLSGIGPAQHLRKHGIKVQVDLPGVGQNLQDHLCVAASFWSDQVFPSASLVAEAGFFTHTRGGLAASAPDLQLLFGVQESSSGNDQSGGSSFSCAPALLRPQSVGSVSLRSANPADLAVVRAHYLECTADLEVLVEGIKLSREIVHTSAFAELGRYELTPGGNVRGDAELREFVRNSCTSLCHPVGTCRMGHDRLAVVDPLLRVHGAAGLRVSDASIMPAIVSGNTNAACIMIGEKAAEVIFWGNR